MHDIQVFLCTRFSFVGNPSANFFLECVQLKLCKLNLVASSVCMKIGIDVVNTRHLNQMPHS